MTDRPIIVGVGLTKTGTTSLANALDLLGWRTHHGQRDHPDRTVEAVINDNALTVGARYFDGTGVDAFLDSAFVLMNWPGIAAAYPDALFICTTRDLDTWAESQRGHRRRTGSVVSDVLATSMDVARYANHHARVLRYFQGDPRLLVLDIEAGDGWPELCGFLDVPRPDVPFPHANAR